MIPNPTSKAGTFFASIPLKILLVDDDEALRALMATFLSSRGHRVRLASNGLDALAAFRAEEPDVVVVDKNMPLLDGRELVVRLKQLLGERWLPIIMMSVDYDNRLHIDALQCGCDDYLVKPVDFDILDAKMQSFRRIANLQRQLLQQRSELDRFYEQTEEEALLIGEIMQRLTKTNSLSETGIRHFIEPTKHFSGDLVAATRSQGNDLYVMLADASGHGLSAAMLLIPVVQTFYAMAGKGFKLEAIAEEMNTKLRPYALVGNFVAACLAILRPSENVLEVWNGGLPNAVFVDHDGIIRRLFRSLNFPLGTVSSHDFANEIERFHYDREGQFVVFSDGLIEAEDHRRHPFGMDRLLDALRTAPRPSRLNRLRSWVDAHCKGNPKHDDVSCAVVDCPYTPLSATADSAPEPSDLTTPRTLWSVAVTLSAAQIKALDLLPLLMNWVQAMGLSADLGSRFFLVMSELYTNALDHGLLELSSSLKEGPQGLEAYITAQEERLERLATGEIQLSVTQLATPAGRRLLLRVQDSGKGFDHQRQTDLAPAEKECSSGFGIGLLRHFCLRLQYAGKGNVVEAELAC